MYDILVGFPFDSYHRLEWKKNWILGKFMFKITFDLIINFQIGTVNLWNIDLLCHPTQMSVPTYIYYSLSIDVWGCEVG